VAAERSRPDLSLKPLTPSPPLRQSVYEALEELIIYGALRPGQHLVETELAARLGVSRNPVREALQLLSTDGWVDLKPRQGAFVHTPTVKEVDEVFDVRRVLEDESARRAARNSTPRSFSVLREVLESGRAALQHGEERELISANTKFHAAVTRMADNRVLERILGRLDKSVRWYFAPVASRRRAASWDEHQALVEAIGRKDADDAARITNIHTEATRRAYHQERARREGSRSESAH
jgi:DNA-binding GntR family transcriptional regulator